MHDHSALPGFVLVQDVRTVRRAFFGAGNTTATANATADAGAPSLADASAPIMRLLGAHRLHAAAQPLAALGRAVGGGRGGAAARQRVVAPPPARPRADRRVRDAGVREQRDARDALPALRRDRGGAAPVGDGAHDRAVARARGGGGSEREPRAAAGRRRG